MKIIEAAAGIYVFQNLAGNSPPVAEAKGKGEKFLMNLCGRINVSLNFFERASAELFALVHRAEGTPVPGTVSGETKQQAPCFAWRAYRPLFELFSSSLNPVA